MLIEALCTQLFARLGDLLSVGLSEYHERRKLVLVDGDDIDDMNLESELSSLEGVLFPISEALGCLVRCVASPRCPMTWLICVDCDCRCGAAVAMPCLLCSNTLCLSCVLWWQMPRCPASCWCVAVRDAVGLPILTETVQLVYCNMHHG